MKQLLLPLLAIAGWAAELGCICHDQHQPAHHNGEVTHGSKLGEAMEPPPRKKPGILAGWQEYTLSRAHDIDAWQPESSKILFELLRRDGPHYVVDIKRSPGRNGNYKDQLWEFPGGRIDVGEQALSSLERELSEEDTSLILKSALERRQQPSGPILYFRNIKLKSSEHATIFKIALYEDDWRRLAAYWRSPPHRNKELYGFTLLPLALLDTTDGDTREEWTPKSRKILHALRRSDSSP